MLVSAVRPRLHRTQGQSELFGDLALAVTLQMLETHYLAFVGLELVDRGAHLPCLPYRLGGRRKTDQRWFVDAGHRQRRGRRRASLRCMSMATRRAIVSSHGAGSLSTSKVDDARHACRNACWVASSAS